MKYLLFIFIAFGLISCSQKVDNNRIVQSRLDSLEKQLAETYKPGFGEFMTGIQAHHSKLWFAGQNQNWKLADFEVHEIMEAIDDIKKYQSDRKESQLIGMILPALDSINFAIQQKDIDLFKGSFYRLTNECNHCHRETESEFNRVIVPTVSPFSNQNFTNEETTQ
jgi:hypothetical protein